MMSFEDHAEDSPVAHMNSDSEPEHSFNACWSLVCCKSASDHAWTVGSSIIIIIIASLRLYANFLVMHSVVHSYYEYIIYSYTIAM